MGRIAQAVLVVVIIVVGLVGYTLVAARTLERSQTELSNAQFQFILSRAAEAIERNLQLGLPLAELQQTDPILSKAAARSPSILAADAFSADGTTLFSTDRGALGEPIPRPWRRAIQERRHGNFEVASTHALTLGQPLRNDFGQIAGWAAIIVDPAARAPPLSRASQLLVRAAPIIAIVAVVAVLFAWLDPMRLFARRRPGLDPFAGSGAETALDRAIVRAVATCAQAESALDEADRQMKALDAKV